MSSRASCTCDKCVSLCSVAPGMFKPGEAERVAEFLGLTLDGLFITQLAVRETAYAPGVLALTPATIGSERGDLMVETWGTCVFLTREGRCSIHDVKPFECREAWCGDGPIAVDDAAYRKVVDAWRPREHQRQLQGLIRRAQKAKAGTAS